MMKIVDKQTVYATFVYMDNGVIVLRLGGTDKWFYSFDDNTRFEKVEDSLVEKLEKDYIDYLQERALKWESMRDN